MRVRLRGWLVQVGGKFFTWRDTEGIPPRNGYVSCCGCSFGSLYAFLLLQRTHGVNSAQPATSPALANAGLCLCLAGSPPFSRNHTRKKRAKFLRRVAFSHAGESGFPKRSFSLFQLNPACTNYPHVDLEPIKRKRSNIKAH